MNGRGRKGHRVEYHGDDCACEDCAEYRAVFGRCYWCGGVEHASDDCVRKEFQGEDE